VVHIVLWLDVGDVLHHRLRVLIVHLEYLERLRFIFKQPCQLAISNFVQFDRP